MKKIKKKKKHQNKKKEKKLKIYAKKEKKGLNVQKFHIIIMLTLMNLFKE